MSDGWPRPRIVVSACLGFEAVRFDGSIIPDGVVAALARHADIVPVCPEVAIGLGSPRPPVRLIETNLGRRLVQPATGRDLTEAMAEFASAFAAQLGWVDGFILKSRSPSCGVRDVRLYPAGGQGPPRGRQRGLFAAVLVEAFPDTPVEDEGRLTNREIRSTFFTRVFASARLRRVRNHRQLVDFHTRYKFLLMAHHPGRARALGRWLANAHSLAWPEAIATYRRGFMEATAHPPTVGRLADTAAHLYGYVADRLSPRERTHFHEALAAFRRRALPADAILTLLESWTARFGQEYLALQTLFEPYPSELESLANSGRS